MYGLEGNINVYRHFHHLLSYIAVDKIVVSETNNPPAEVSIQW